MTMIQLQVLKWESDVAFREREVLSRSAEKEQQLLGESKAEQQVAASLRLRELALRTGGFLGLEVSAFLQFVGWNNFGLGDLGWTSLFLGVSRGWSGKKHGYLGCGMFTLQIQELEVSAREATKILWRLHCCRWRRSLGDLAQTWSRHSEAREESRRDGNWDFLAGLWNGFWIVLDRRSQELSAEAMTERAKARAEDLAESLQDRARSLAATAEAREMKLVQREEELNSHLGLIFGYFFWGDFASAGDFWFFCFGLFLNLEDSLSLERSWPLWRWEESILLHQNGSCFGNPFQNTGHGMS